MNRAPIVPSYEDETEVVVATRSGRIRGRIDRGVARFLGIRYAAAPFGANRLRPPAPVQAWSGIRDALEFGPTAPKGGHAPALARFLPEPSVPGDECLNLNVWAPSPPGGSRPVMVWIHGGSFRNGSSAVPVYDGHAFARDGVVLVSINYRLGVEGFAVFPDAPSNRGLLDQIAALTWVRDNISAFGGDPNNVTIFGESAGAIAIGALLVSPYAKGLFRRAVLQSGPPMAVTPEEGAHITKHIAKRLGVAPTAAAFAKVDQAALLKAQVEASQRGNPLSGGSGFSVVIDGDVVPVDPAKGLRDGASAGVDLLVGYNREEYRLWFVPTGMVDRINSFTLRIAMAKLRIPVRIVRTYRANRPAAKPGELLGIVAGDKLMRVPLNRLAQGRRSANTFMYEFAWPSPVDRLGACHALEIAFVFDTLSLPESIAMAGPDAPQDVADAMHRAWIAFARTGDPGWPPYGSTRTVMRFDAPVPAVVEAPADDELKLWS